MRTTLSILAALAMTLALGAPAAAITNGEADGTAHPNVAALLGYDPGTGEYFFVCSGTLLSDRHVLTAAHCATWETVGQTADNVFVTFDADLRTGDPFEWASFGPIVEPARVVGLDTDHPKDIMPGFWIPAGGAQSRNDVAVLHLAAPASAIWDGIQPVELPSAGFLDARAANGGLVGHELTNAGYGFQSISWRNPTTPAWFNGLRMTSTSPVAGLTRHHLAMLENSRATGDGGVCMGDSGGPSFFGPAGTGRATLQVSLNVGQGYHDCDAGINTGQRLDLPEVLEFLAPWR